MCHIWIKTAGATNFLHRRPGYLLAIGGYLTLREGRVRIHHPSDRVLASPKCTGYKPTQSFGKRILVRNNIFRSGLAPLREYYYAANFFAGFRLWCGWIGCCFRPAKTTYPCQWAPAHRYCFRVCCWYFGEHTDLSIYCSGIHPRVGLGQRNNYHTNNNSASQSSSRAGVCTR